MDKTDESSSSRAEEDKPGAALMEKPTSPPMKNPLDVSEDLHSSASIVDESSLEEKWHTYAISR